MPWERVFIDRDYDRVNRIWEINSNAFTGVQTSVRLMAKLQFAAGVAKRGDRDGQDRPVPRTSRT